MTVSCGSARWPGPIRGSKGNRQLVSSELRLCRLMVLVCLPLLLIPPWASWGAATILLYLMTTTPT